MQIVFIRHSMTAGNLERRYIGCRTDEPLCEAGISLAQQKTAEIRQTFPMPEVVLTSPSGAVSRRRRSFFRTRREK